MSRLLDNLLFFGRVLRRVGIDVHPGRMIDLVEALGHINLAARDEVYHTCRALLVHRPEQIAVFDSAFDNFWNRRLGQRSAGASLATPPPAIVDELEAPASPQLVAHGHPIVDSDDAMTPVIKTWSGREGLAVKDFAAL